MPNMPDLLTGPPEDPQSVTLALPDNSSVPLPALPGVDVSQGVAAVVPGTAAVHTLHTVTIHYLGPALHRILFGIVWWQPRLPEAVLL
jgi:hypothetical protein